MRYLYDNEMLGKNFIKYEKYRNERKLRYRF